MAEVNAADSDCNSWNLGRFAFAHAICPDVADTIKGRGWKRTSRLAMLYRSVLLRAIAQREKHGPEHARLRRWKSQSEFQALIANSAPVPPCTSIQNVASSPPVTVAA